MQRVTVREYARLTTGQVEASLDQATVTESAFDWLCRESSRLRKSGAPLVQVDDRRWLRLDNYVGVIETPCGTQVEILPKHLEGFEEATDARRLLRTMLSRCMDLPVRETRPARIQAFNSPLTEWVARQFLDKLDYLVKRGIRFQYHTLQEQQRYLRGRLDIARQVRQPPGRQHVFQIEHDVFDPDRPENRLLRSALDRVCLVTRDAGNWRLSHELAGLLSSVPPSADIQGDFRRWRDDRLMTHYRPVRPWCSLILNEQSPLSVLGEWNGVSLLFPMERLFERYVEVCLRDMLQTGAILKRTASTKYLCHHLGEQWFLLRPDLLLRHGSQTWVLDTKWKLIDVSLVGSKEKYGLSQSDFYQLFAYGQRYMDGEGDLFLVYPMTPAFDTPLPVFSYSSGMRLWVVPFDLDQGVLLTSELPLRVPVVNSVAA